MRRPRVHLHTPATALLVRALAVLLALALLWYGAMVVLLAVKVSPHTVDSLSAYRALYDHLTRLHEHDFTTLVRVVAGVAGVVACFVLVFLAFEEIPRPYLARSQVRLQEGEHGRTLLAPRAIERMAEIAARGSDGVTAASGRLDGRQLGVLIGVSRTNPAEVLEDVRRRVRSDLERHELPSLPVNVTLNSLR